MNSGYIALKDIAKLHIVVTLIGYRSQGESIIVRLVESDVTLYCLVVDCYSLRKRNITVELLRSYHVSHINLLCWSHPHLDHSKGLDDLLYGFCDKSTEYLIPVYFNNGSNDIVTISNKDEKKIVDAIFLQNAKTQTSVTGVSVKAMNFNQITNFKLSDFSNSIPFTIKALTPISSRLEQYAHESRRDVGINELSICLLVEIGDYKMLFSSDAVDEHIENINPDYLEGCRFVKIPHHGSKTSLSLLEVLPGQFDVAGVTGYHLRGDLPMREEVVERYKNEKKCKVFCTSGYEKKNSPLYGYIEYDINLFEKDFVNYQINCVNGAEML